MGLCGVFSFPCLFLGRLIFAPPVEGAYRSPCLGGGICPLLVLWISTAPEQANGRHRSAASLWLYFAVQTAILDRCPQRLHAERASLVMVSRGVLIARWGRAKEQNNVSWI